MKSSKLQRVPPPPPPPEPPTCYSCRTMRPEVYVPHGQDVLELCWWCAHQVVDHGIHPDAAYCGECSCKPDAVYPEEIISARHRHDQQLAQVLQPLCKPRAN